MQSWGHAVAVLSAASDFAGVGVACNPSGGAVVIELFADADATSASAGQARLQSELAANNEYVASGGTVATVYEPPQDGGAAVPAQDVFPQNPIAAGSEFASGVDWTCNGPVYPAGGAPVTPLPAPVTGIAASSDDGGYTLVDGAGAVSVHGDGSFHGGANGLALTSPIAHIVPTPDGGGYWLVAGDGGVFCYGDAEFYGSMGGQPLNAPVVSLSPTPDGGGYWLVAADGGIFSFGDARFYGSMGGQHLNAPIVGISTNQAGSGYWLVASDGGVFSFGAAFYGSTGSIPLNQPIVGISATPDGGGIGWLPLTEESSPSAMRHSTDQQGDSPWCSRLSAWRLTEFRVAIGWLPGMAGSSHSMHRFSGQTDPRESYGPSGNPT